MHVRKLSTLLFFVVVASVLVHGRVGRMAPIFQAPTRNAVVKPVPDDLQDVSWLNGLRDAQIKSIAGVAAFHDFQFTDRLAESGITFRHRIVDDAGKTYKAAHYDHGNGLAMADVDGDGLLDIYFVNQVGGNQLWKNLGGGKFQDITASAGVAVPGKISVSASFADIDNDGDADLYVTTVRGGNMLFENDGHGRFTRHLRGVGPRLRRDTRRAPCSSTTTATAGSICSSSTSAGTRRTRSAGDGYKYYVGVRGRLLRPPEAGAGRAQHPVPQRGRQPLRRRLAADGAHGHRPGPATRASVDVNDDGWPDLYVLNMQGDDQYYENVGGKRFVKKSRQVFPRTSWGAMGIKVFDFNNDGRLDIFITDMHSDMSETIGPEREKLKSDMKWPESFRGDGQDEHLGQLVLPQGRSRQVPRSLRRDRRRRTTARGDRASATSTPTASTTRSSRPG